MQRKFILKCVLVGLLYCFQHFNLQAQFNMAAGIRIGGTNGLTVKHFYKPEFAVEGILGTFGNGFSLTALIEKYQPVYEAPGLFVYYGGGAHLAIYNGSNTYHSNFGREVDYRKGNDVGFGINGVVGLAYRLPNNIPIAFSLELKPFIEVGSAGYVSVAPDPAIGIQFIIR